jgi:hypothetical protein
MTFDHRGGTGFSLSSGVEASDLLMSWRVCEPNTWRGHSCLPRRESSRRFSEWSEKPRGHHSPVPSHTIGGVGSGTKRKASTRVSTRQAGVPAPHRGSSIFHGMDQVTATTSGVQRRGLAGESACPTTQQSRSQMCGGRPRPRRIPWSGFSLASSSPARGSAAGQGARPAKSSQAVKVLSRCNPEVRR